MTASIAASDRDLRAGIRSEREGLAFASADDLHRGVRALNHRSVHGVEVDVVVGRIMVTEDEFPNATGASKQYGVFERAVAPADARGVLGVGVLGIVDQHIRVRGEIVTRSMRSRSSSSEPQPRVANSRVARGGMWKTMNAERA